MKEIRLYIMTDASPFRQDRSATRYELDFVKDGQVTASREDRFVSDGNQQSAILEGLITAISRIHDGSGMKLTVICPSGGVICSINQKQYEIWSQNGWLNSRGNPVKHAEEWQRVRELIRTKLADITARPPSTEDDPVMKRLGAEEINPRLNTL